LSFSGSLDGAELGSLDGAELGSLDTALETAEEALETADEAEELSWARAGWSASRERSAAAPIVKVVFIVVVLEFAGFPPKATNFDRQR
jgi:hypothetical protein